MNTENMFAGYVKATAGELRVVVRYDNDQRIVVFQKITQDPTSRGPWFYAYVTLLDASRMGKGILLEAAAPLWGYPEWSLTTAELARAVYSATEAFEILDADIDAAWDKQKDQDNENSVAAEALSAALRGVR